MPPKKRKYEHCSAFSAIKNAAKVYRVRKCSGFNIIRALPVSKPAAASSDLA